MSEPVMEDKPDRIRIFVDGKAVAKAYRDDEAGGDWVVMQIVPTRLAAAEACMRLARNAHPKAEVL